MAACGLDTKSWKELGLQMLHLVVDLNGEWWLLPHEICFINNGPSLSWILNYQTWELRYFHHLPPWSLLQGCPLVPDRCLWSWRGVDWRRTSNARQDKWQWEDVYIQKFSVSCDCLLYTVYLLLQLVTYLFLLHIQMHTFKCIHTYIHTYIHT